MAEFSGNSYELIIRNAESGNGAGGASATAATGQTIGGGADKAKNTLVRTVAQVWSATSLIRTGVEATEQIITRNMGNSQAVAKIGAINSLVTKGVGIGLAFAVGRPLAGGLAIASEGISYGRQVEQYNYDKRWEQVSLQRTFERAGPSFNRSRTRF